MKALIISFLCLLVYACKEDKPKGILQDPPPIYHSTLSEKISIKEDIVYLDGQRYDGFLVQMSPNGKDTQSVEGFKNGLLTGTAKKWFPNQQLMEERQYLNGKKHGKQVAYWENGNKRFEFLAQNDAYEGELKEWSSNGHLFHLGNYVQGQEVGSQKMWYDNGKIRANYVILNGKRYGLLGTKNCKNVSDSVFVNQ